ncbi:S-adenosyl-L-methionine-dependent methyltransferase [Epithele typhae]|uniref:S-adenosyl-L-methionine-dependent methyltransferase n=1 Tax=Epithele typhae TaxID=378194 RepID=UPI002007C42B|nr:S-adenosyl-L-methionine-dependent methyltransferase [Epithele typhae]KAH9916743.1 S-adenosyl-L-methionine-dependent methyltransferase [Epithele typhae]
MTFADLRAMHALIGDALDEIEAIYRDASFDSPASTTPYAPPTSPCTPFRRKPPPEDASDTDEPLLHDQPPRSPKTPRRPRHSSSLDSFGGMLDYPSLDAPYYPTQSHDPEEEGRESLASHPDVLAAANRIVAACSQISATVHRPFLTLCDAAMGYHLPACLRFLEASHLVEILRAAGPAGMHVRDLSRLVDVDEGNLSHNLRLLATHHITREVRPNVFANNRISAILDSGKIPEELLSNPQTKYEATNGIAAFINLCTDELFKSAGYLADCFLPALSMRDKQPISPMYAPFNLAFKTDSPYFEWLEQPGNESRLKRFGPAMTGTAAWEVPGAIVSGFAWDTLPEGSLVVDVGGGIGSTAMQLAHTFSHLNFVIQDRPQVVEQGITVWRERCPDMLTSRRAMFLAHDFFLPQPSLSFPSSTSSDFASVYILRDITHDWPDLFVTKILVNLRRAASSETKLLIADHILPHACADDSDESDTNVDLPGLVRSLAPEGSPLLSNLGKANAVAYWLDLTMRSTFNAQERTLREMSVLARSAGWKIVAAVHEEGSLFGHITAIPVDIPSETLALIDEAKTDKPTRAVRPTGGRSRSMSAASALSASSSIRMDTGFGTQVVLPSDDVIRKPARKDRRSFIPWARKKHVPVPDAPVQVLTPESLEAPKPAKRRPRLSFLSSPPPTSHDARPSQKGQHARHGSTVRILSPEATRSAVWPASRDTSESSGAALGPPASLEVSPLLPALEPAPPTKPRMKRATSKQSLKEKASQVFRLRKASAASLRSASQGESAGQAGSSVRLKGVEESPRPSPGPTSSPTSAMTGALQPAGSGEDGRMPSVDLTSIYDR